MKNLVIMFSVCLALVVCVIGVFGDQFVVTGRDKVNPDAGGGTLFRQYGEDLVFGTPAASSRSKVPFPSNTGQLLYHISSSGSDTQVMVIDGLDANWDRIIVRDTLTGQTSDTLGNASWTRVNSIKLLVPAVGNIWITTGSIIYLNEPDSSALVYYIPPTASEGMMGTFSVPRSYVATAQLMFSVAQSKTVALSRTIGYSGVVGLKTRTTTDTTWKNLVQMVVGGDGVFSTPWYVTLTPQSDNVVAAGVTTAVVDIVGIMRVDTRRE